MRRLMLAVGAIGAIGVSAVLAAAVSAAQTSVVPATVSFSLSGSVAGKVKTASTPDQVTLVFTEKNTGTTSTPEDLVLQRPPSNGTVENQSCVLANGSMINTDGYFCEPGFVAPGQSASTVVSLTVSGSGPRTVSAKVCLQNETSGAIGPCKTLSVAGV
jgi:hypothetical protein